MELAFRPISKGADGALEAFSHLNLPAGRARYLEEFSALPLPSTDEELWRYTDISFLGEQSWSLPESLVEGRDGVAVERLPDVGVGESSRLDALFQQARVDSGLYSGLAPLSGLAAICDGGPEALLLTEKALQAGVSIATASLKDEIPSDLGFSLVSPDQDKFTALVAALGSAVVLRVPDGATIEEPLLISMNISDAGKPLVVPVHLVVEIGDGARLTLFVHYSGPASATDNLSLSLPVTEISLGKSSRLEYVTLQEYGRSVSHIETSRITLSSDAWLSSTAVALGAKLSRQRIESAMAGERSESEMLGIYFGSSDQHIDFRTLQDHQAPRTVSDLLYKGAVEDTATAVYAGLVRVEKDAQKINGFQTNKNLVLSEGASAESIPTLEILANDVRCSHASSIGPIDEEELYYLESRGIAPDLAARLIVEGFFEEVIERIPSGLAAARLRAEVAEKFAGRESK